MRREVNGLYQYLQSTDEPRRRQHQAAFERAFDIEIDSYVFIGFQGVKGLINAVGGVDVRLHKSYYDPYYWVNGHTRAGACRPARATSTPSGP